ncbi:MAG: YceD family protein [Bacteroidia bacterium]|nr:YceD family protein [Bacteroidia bacterium]
MSYRLVISQLPQGETLHEWEIRADLFEIIGSSYDILDLSVQAQVRARREAGHLRLELHLKGWVIVPCDRGLEPIQLPIETSHEQIYSWDTLYLPPEGTEEFYTLGPREDSVDLAQSFYDYICLAIPSKRVRPTCPDGACPPYIQAYLEISPEEG